MSDDKIKWMYDGTKADVNREDFLLGKKLTKDFTLYSDAVKEDPEIARAEALKNSFIKTVTKPAATNRKVTALALDVVMHEDPLVALKTQEEMRKRAVIENPVFQNQLRRAFKTEDGKKHHSKKHKKHRNKHADDSDEASTSKHSGRISRKRPDRSDSDSEDSRHSHISRHRNDSDSHRHRQHHQDHRDRESRYESPSKRNDRLSRRSSSPKRRGRSRSPDRRRQRSRSPDRRRERSRSPDRRRVRSRSPHKRRERSRSPQRRHDRRRNSIEKDTEKKPFRSRRSPSPVRSKKADDAEEMEQKRLQMLANANWRTEKRHESIVTAKEKLQKEVEEDEKSMGKGPSFLKPMTTSVLDTQTLEQALHQSRNRTSRASMDMKKSFVRR